MNRNGEISSGNVTRRIVFVCPDCGCRMSREITLPADFQIFHDGDHAICDPCGKSRKDAQAHRLKVQADQQRINATGVPPQFRAYEPPRGNAGMLAWVNSNAEKNILLMSEVNTGKTRAMCKALLDASKSGLRCRYVEFVDLASQYSGEKKESTTAAQRLLKRILGIYDILFIDDIDKQKLTDTTGELLYKLLNAVYSGNAKARVWLTMNCTGGELQRKFEVADQGAAVLSRIDRMKEDDRFAIRRF